MTGAIGRRQFLTGAAAAAAALAVGCSSDSEGAARTTGPSTTAMAAPTTSSVPDLATDPFTLGVASGDPLTDRVILWTRLVTDLDDQTGTGGIGEPPPGADEWAVRWEVASDEKFEKLVASGDEPAPADLGHSVHVDVDGLEPDTWYWYRFRIGDHTSPVARTRTTPAPDADVDRLRFAFASCQLRSGGYWTAYDAMAEDDLDVVFHLGDYVYEYPGGEGDLAVPLDTEPQNIGDYRRLYGAYKRDPKIQAAHTRCPWIVTWDDHEVENNVAGAVPEKDADRDTFPERRAAAFQAFWEHHPLRIDAPTDDGLHLYRSFTYGDLADIWVLDGRQYRSDQACGDKIPTVASECAELDDPKRTMLGEEQEKWLHDGLAKAQRTWKVIAQQTVVKALVIGDLVLNVDQWDGYPAARRRLLEAIADGGVDNVVVLTGDIHAAGAADLRLPDAGQEGSIVASELVCPGISSPGLIPDGLVDPSTFGLVHANLKTNGYVRCEVTPEKWKAEFIDVDISVPTAPAKVDATLELTAGEHGLKAV